MPRPTRALAVRVALVVGLAAIALAVGLVLSRPPLTVAGSDRIAAVPHGVFSALGGRSQCQPGGTVPRGTRAVRLSLAANTGPSVSVRILLGSTLVTDGRREAGWGIDETVTVPVAPVPVSVSDARLCVVVGPAVEPIQGDGRAVNTNTLWLGAEYMRPGRHPWSSLVAPIAARFGLAHAPSGTWVAYLLVGAMLALCALSARVILRELG
jgi:hypothetical protein